MNRINNLLTVQSQSIQNKGEIQGIKQQQKDALDNQKENEKEYKKEQRHRILHAIISIFAHVVNLVMTIIRPVKHIAKMAKKGISKAVNKSVGKAAGKLASHFDSGIIPKGAGQPMRKAVTGINKGLKAGVEESGLAKKALTNISQGGVKSFLKRSAMINGIADGVNGISDGVFTIQEAKIKNIIANNENNVELISENNKMNEDLKKKAQDVLARNADETMQMKKNVNNAIDQYGNLQMQLLTKAA